MNGTTLPKCYQNHQPPAGYYDAPDPYNPRKMDFGYDMHAIIEYATQNNIDPGNLSWDELQRFRFEMK